jgi:hypothetical protein
MAKLPRLVVQLLLWAKDQTKYSSGGPVSRRWEQAEVLLALHYGRAPELPPRRPEWILDQCLPNGERQETA